MSAEPPRVLLTGATGFLGRPALAALRRRGVETVTLGRRAPEGASAAHLEVDLLAPENLAERVAEARPTHLLHLAWTAEHGKFWTAPENLDWAAASARLAAAFLAAGGRRLVGVGSCAEYDWTQGYLVEDATPCRPATLYGTAKDATRRLWAAAAAASGASAAWARVFFLVGPGEPAARLLPSLVAAFAGERPLFGVNAGSYRDFAHVEDVAEAIAVVALGDAVGPVNVSSGAPLRIEDLVRRVAARLGADPEPALRLATERPGEPRMIVGDPSKLLALGAPPMRPVGDAIDAAVDAVRT